MLEYNMDITPASRSRVFAPSLPARMFPFYATEAGDFRAGRDYYTKRDGKEAALLMVTYGGEGVVEWRGRSALLTAGTAVVIDCAPLHMYKTGACGKWEFRWLHFEGTGLEGYRAPLMSVLTPVTLENSDALAKIDTLFLGRTTDGIKELAEESDAISHMLTTMLAALPSDGSRASLGREDVRTIADYIRKNCPQQISLAGLSEMAHISPCHLIRVFSRQIGMPPYQYLHVCRINRAQRLIRESDMSISEIAAQVGYSDSVSLIRHFKSIVDMTPGEYRAESIRIKPV